MPADPTGQPLALTPGTYKGTVILTSPSAPSPALIPVTLYLTANPLVTFVLNAVSLIPGPLPPSEIVTLFGQGIGPITPDTSNVQVLFNGIAAKLLYAYSTQINAMVPPEISGPTATITVNHNGTQASDGTYRIQ